MSTPSKEALEAAKELFPDAISFYRFVAENAAEIAELKKQEAESRRLFYAEQDKRQSAEFRCEELAWALRGMLARYAPTHSGLCGALRTDGTNEPCHCDESAQTARDVLARHAAGDPEAQK